ncbi:MAG: metallophosphoesterase [Verrucomicrobia bacterium]|nr:metallophosphoesterase [Verrucomicrobiota bacterium]MCG2678941.1 metallophosphoesterase [Kiritimatiellia bacterium]MBU4248278.1 metallophosphoesterase [Verrucomicrobiota bacterium]MBU4291767.1 metallophosphoesterase [Verrucomicrobiota bacterium]MBU4429617.1 metallophosphoesterase [Verrucomicrobiota bacterium]
MPKPKDHGLNTALDTPLFRFFLWNDMHVDAPQYLPAYPHYPFANEKAGWAVECASGKYGFEQPAFVVGAGDIINGKDNIGISATREEFAYLKSSVLNKLKMPFLPCVGNHENCQGEGIPENNLSYDGFFGSLWHNYVFTYGGAAFIVVDTSGAHRLPDAVTAARNAFVCRAFDRFGQMPDFVVTHVPLIAMRQEKVLIDSFGFDSWHVLDTQMLDIVEAHADSMIAVLCGHIHLTSVRRQNGVYHIMPAGTCGNPCDFASVECFSNRIVIRMHKGPEQWFPPDRKGDIHGKPRYDIDYFDDSHPDHESYIWGNPNERTLTIPLHPGKRIIGGTKHLEIFHEVGPNKWNEVKCNALQGGGKGVRHGDCQTI